MIKCPPGTQKMCILEAGTKALKLERISNKKNMEGELGQIHNTEIYFVGRDRRQGNWDLGSKRKRRRQHYEVKGLKLHTGTVVDSGRCC